jgi:mRNA interferase RelE/StbE
MKLLYSSVFQRSYADAPAQIQKQCMKQIALLAQDLRHPSVRAKKYDESRGLWQGRVNRNWRFYFVIDGDSYYMVDVMAHPK